MNELHVGRGTTRGGLTVFPVWSAESGVARYTTDIRHLDVTECEDGPQVPTLMLGNTGDRPLLVLEGQLFEGGWQHRMATRSVLVGVHQRVPVEVACVENGRWGGTVRQASRGRRATPFVRDAVRAAMTGHGDVQGEVWSRVGAHTRGTDNATGSLVRRLDAAPPLETDAFRVLPGQCGVLVGTGGQPLLLEVFDSTRTLRAQFQAIIEAAALDATCAPPRATPTRRAHRFVERLEKVRLTQVDAAGLACTVAGRSDLVDAAGVRWGERDLHLRASYLRHPMLAGGVL